MKKLGLCVRYDCNNYGSMLQILATQKAIERIGWNYEIIRYDKKTPLFLLKSITRLFNPYFMKGKKMELFKRYAMIKHKDIQSKNAERLIKFKEYRQDNLGPYSPVLKGYKNLVAGSTRYDAVMVGSDQLWTPAGLSSRFYNLIFVPDVIKKISLATSFGVTEIPPNQVKETAYYLNRIDYLSVRELSGASIVKKLTGKEAKVVVDPTLFFSCDEWESFLPTQNICNEPYIFAYFLGNNIKHRNVVTLLAQKTGLKIVTCPHLDEFVEVDLNFGDIQRFDISPIDFLNIIRGATYICTDSFHGSIFSLLNHKLFLTFNRYDDKIRKSKNTRIDSLFEQLEINERRWNGAENIYNLIEKPINYEKVEHKLASLRANAFTFLQKALNE